MTIKSIKYENYRCFKNLTLNFDTIPGKNIFMVVAPNGGGKTEMLFSFQWVLYGFDFAKLNAKESTPYALNSTLYQHLEEGIAGDSRRCSVELTFESNGKTYTIKRIETFKRKYRSNEIWSEQTVEFSETNANGVKSTCETDPETVEERLARIIPKNILQGIIFDGERMKRLSQVTDESKDAVEGVIRQITNEDLFDRCRTEFKSLLKENKKAINILLNKAGASELSEIETKIQKDEADIESKESQLKIYAYEYDELRVRLLELHELLSEIAESKAYEDRRSALKKELDDAEKSYNDYFEYLYEDLDDGYLLICDKLFDDVDKLLTDYDIPADLTVSAVKNILARDTCICGHPFTDESRAILEELISKLPPDNINSTIGEMVRNARMDKKSLSEKLARTYKEIRKAESNINALKDKISDISALITSNASDKIKDLEKENIAKTKRLGVVETEISRLEKELEVLKKEVVNLKKSRDDGSQLQGTLIMLYDREKYINKCLDALDAIDENNKMVSLQDINTRINDAYELLSEDYVNGRRLYIVQHDKKTKYRMASYMDDKYQQAFLRLSQNNGLAACQASGMSMSEIQEYVILKVLESNSTGQAKINTLAFAKAILDYSRAERASDSTEISRSYPFLIDSPFTELSDGNLKQSAENIHNFAEQVILMISKESLDSVAEQIKPYIGKVVELEKSVNDSYSTLKKN